MPTACTVAGQRLLNSIKDDWKLGPIKGDRRREHLKLNGVFVGQLTYEEDGGVRHTYDVVLALQLQEDGRVSGKRYAADERGTPLPEAVIDSTSNWRSKGGYVSLKIHMTTPASQAFAASTFLVEGTGFPGVRRITTVTWQQGVGTGRSAYHPGTDFKWLAEDIAQAQIAVNASVFSSTPNAAGFTDPVPAGGTAKTRPAPNPQKPGSQVMSQPPSDRGSGLGIFVSEAEMNKAMSYQKKYGRFPPEIEQRMASKGMGEGTQLEHDRAQMTWNKIKETFDNTRARGGDGTLPSKDRDTRIQNWLAMTEAPAPGYDPMQPLDSRQSPKKPPLHPSSAPRGGDGAVAGSGSGVALRLRPPTVPKPGPVNLLPRPGAGADPPSWQPGLSPNWPKAHDVTAPSPTYGMAGMSPHPNSVAADMGDETPAYGELLAGTSPGYALAGQSPGYAVAGQSPGYAVAGQSPGYGVSPNRVAPQQFFNKKDPPPPKDTAPPRPTARKSAVLSLLRSTTTASKLPRPAPAAPPRPSDDAWEGRPRTPKKPSATAGTADEPAAQPTTPQTSPQDMELDAAKLPPPPPRDGHSPQVPVAMPSPSARPQRDPRDVPQRQADAAHSRDRDRSRDRRDAGDARDGRDREHDRDARDLPPRYVRRDSRDRASRDRDHHDDRDRRGRDAPAGGREREMGRGRERE